MGHSSSTGVSMWRRLTNISSKCCISLYWLVFLWAISLILIYWCCLAAHCFPVHPQIFQDVILHPDNFFFESHPRTYPHNKQSVCVYVYLKSCIFNIVICYLWNSPLPVDPQIFHDVILRPDIFFLKLADQCVPRSTDMSFHLNLSNRLERNMYRNCYSPLVSSYLNCLIILVCLGTLTVPSVWLHRIFIIVDSLMNFRRY